MANNNNHPDYLESLFKGIDIILEKRLDNVSFDTTVICTITDASNSKNGEYRVTDGSVSYKAYSDVDSYVAGEQVRVSVPMGDFSQKKFITGKYVIDNNSSPITYVSPLNSVVNISGNLVPIGTTSGIVANGTEMKRIIWNQRMDSGNYGDLQANGIYNTIILKADFKTLFYKYDLLAGTYGLRLDLLVRPSVESTGRIRRYVELSSKEMFGNPYAFTIFSTQAKTFTISTIGIVEGIELSIYQNGDFKDRTLGYFEPNTLTDDIIVSNIELGFGSDIVDIDNNIVKIYSENDLRYKYQNPTDDTNKKKIGLLWYNKDDNNQYIGFSDGIFAPTYDEFEYLEKSRMDTRLLAQKGREGVPTDKDSLNLAANIEEAIPLIQKARDIINQDLTRTLQDLRQQIVKVDTLKNIVNKLLLTSGERYLGNYSKAITTALSDTSTGACGMVEQYAGILDFARDTQLKLPDDRHSVWNSKWNTKYYETITTNFQNVRTAITQLKTELKAAIDAEFGVYKSVYDTYVIRLDRIITSMDQYLGMAVGENVANKNFPAGVLNGTDYNLLKTYQTKSEFKTYKEQDLSAYDGKYCIYWYRYEKDYKCNDVEALMPDGWRRLTFHDFYREITLDSSSYEKNRYYIYDSAKNEYKISTANFSASQTYYEKTTDDADFLNVGLSGQAYEEDGVTEIKNEAGKPVHAVRPEPGYGMFSRYMQYDLEEEKYIAILFFNHNMYKSNELVFTNSDVIPDKTTLDKGDILIFEHGENSSDNFQLYNELGYLMDASDEHMDRRIRCHYDGLLAKDEALVGAGIYWYVPNNEDTTLLNYDKQFLANRGFTTDLDLSDDEKPDFSKNGYACFYKQVEAQKKCSTCGKLWNQCNCSAEKAIPYWDYENGGQWDNRDFWYKIKNNYDDGATQNSLICEVRISEDRDPVKGEQLFTFGVFGTNGTKYTLDLSPADQTKIAVSDTEGMELNMTLTNARGEVLPLYTATTPSNLEPGQAYNCKADWYFRRQSQDGGLVLQPAGGTEATGLLIDKASWGIVEVTAQFAMPTNEEEADVNGAPLKSREVQLDCLQAIPWTSGYYHVSGPKQIVYNSYGTLDNTSMFDKPYKIYRAQDKIENGVIVEAANTEVTGVTWSVEYYVLDGKKFILLKDDPNDADKHKQYTFYRQYMPVINDGGGLTPASLYLDNLDCFVVVVAKKGSDRLWEQPIIITQNRYASSMLNSWDGSLTIDENNGTILSTMIGAGRKTQDNAFEGVLMGNIALGTESNIGFENAGSDGTLNGDNLGYSNHTGLGLYGFHEGAQSFGFNINGSAFLGKAGRGRIIFNGDYGVIASSNWFAGSSEFAEKYPDQADEIGGIVGENPETGERGILQTSTAGMCIDLENGHIDSYDFKLTGSRIHFNSHPEKVTGNNVTGYLMRIGHDGKTLADPAERWLLDPSNDNQSLKDLATPGYLAMDGAGNLTMRVNSLYLTEQLGGANLLHQTAPKKSIPVQRTENGELVYDDDGNPVYHDANGNIEYVYDVSKWKRADSVAVDGAENVGPSDDKKDVVVKVCDSNWTIYQTFKKLSTEKKYTISGWVRGEVAKEGSHLEIEVNNISTDANGNEVVIANYNADGTPTENGVVIADTSESNTNLGSYAFGNVNWVYFEYTVIAKAGFTKLRVTFKGDCNYCLWHAKAEEGSIATTWCPSEDDSDANVINVRDNYDMYLAQDAIFNKLVKDPITGQTMVGIWMLPAEESASGRKELYINATYIATGILKSSNCDIKFKKKNNKPELSAVLDKDGKPVTDNYGRQLYTYEIDTFPTQGVYFNLDLGKLWAATFELTAGQNNNILYLNSDPGTGNYFKIGNTTNYLQFTGGGELSVTAQVFNLSAGTANSENYLGLFSSDIQTATIGSSGSTNTWRIIAGNKFGVTKAGVLYASGAIISGNITATTLTATESGQIGGWNINATSLYKGNMKLYANGTNGWIEAGYCKINSSGYLSATEATLTTLHVNKSLDINKDGGEGSLSVAGDTTISGTTSISGKLTVGTSSKPADTSIAGNTAITGKLVIGSSTMPTTESKTLYINGTSQVTKEMTFDADIVLTGDIGARRIWGNKNKANDQCIYFDDSRTYLAGGTTQLASKTVYVGKGDDANGAANFVYILGEAQINAKTLVKGDFYYESQIWGKGSDDNYHQGKTGTITLKSLTSEHKLSFARGLFIGSDKDMDDSIFDSGLPALDDHAGHFLQVGSDETSMQWTAIYAPTTKGTSGTVWSSSGSGDNATPAWRTMKELLNPPQAANAFLSNSVGGGGSQGVNVNLNWVTAYPPTTKGTATQVWAGGGTSNPSWKTIGATLVNFTDTTTVNGPYTSGNTTYYTVKVPYTKNSYTTKEETVTVNTTQYVRFGKPSATTGKVTLYECTYNEAINRDTSVYPYYGVVYSSGSKKVTVIDTTSSSTAYTTGSVEIQVSLS